MERWPHRRTPTRTRNPAKIALAGVFSNSDYRNPDRAPLCTESLTQEFVLISPMKPIF